jgi:hypothetical protein
MKSILGITFLLFMLNTSAQTSYKYFDGNNNTFIVNDSLVKYVPVKAKESSSGIYSGGKAKQVKITKDKFQRLEKLFSEAFEKESEKQIIREMMSGALSEYYTNKLKKEAILKPKSEIKKKIEAELSSLLNN